MTTREEWSFLKNQAVATEHLAGMVEDHPLMGPLMRQRADAFHALLEQASEPEPEARIELYFGGAPVRGTVAIDAQFMAQALIPFLDVVKSEYAAYRHGPLSERGPRPGEGDARLMLVGTPRGSFGVELAAPDTDDLFAQTALADALNKASEILEAAGGPEDAFLAKAEDMEPRAFKQMVEFLALLQKNEASIRIKTAGREFELDTERVRTAYNRASSSRTIDRVTYSGIFRGATLESWRFDFRRDDGQPISGRLSADLSEDAVVGMLSFVNQHVAAEFDKMTTITPQGARNPQYTLLALVPKSST